MKKGIAWFKTLKWYWKVVLILLFLSVLKQFVQHKGHYQSTNQSANAAGKIWYCKSDRTDGATLEINLDDNSSFHYSEMYYDFASQTPRTTFSTGHYIAEGNTIKCTFDNGSTYTLKYEDDRLTDMKGQIYQLEDPDKKD